MFCLVILANDDDDNDQNEIQKYMYKMTSDEVKNKVKRSKSPLNLMIFFVCYDAGKE